MPYKKSRRKRESSLFGNFGSILPSEKHIYKGLEKQRRRYQLDQNITQGKLAEQNYLMDRAIKGIITKRRAHGSDYEERSTDLLGRPRGPKRVVEIKSSKTAPMTKLQKKDQRKYKKKYRVLRY